MLFGSWQKEERTIQTFELDAYTKRKPDEMGNRQLSGRHTSSKIRKKAGRQMTEENVEIATLRPWGDAAPKPFAAL